MLVEMWPIDKPIPYARNARKLTGRAVDKVAASIKEFGFRQPIVVDIEGVIVVGHTRLMGAKKLGLTEVPVHVATGLTPAQIKAYRLADNRTNQETDWDRDLLGPEFGELKELGFDLTLTAFDMGEIEELIDPTAISSEAARQTLSERFLVPPFSVLDARQGYWQERKRAWLALGIQSELGRGGHLAGVPDRQPN